jgi:phage terminase Nu1 subunit (DNA packaging protein)
MKPFEIKSPLNALKQNDISALFGVTDRTIRNWIAEGLPGNGEGRGRLYDWPTVLAWRDDRISGFRGTSADLTDKERKLKGEADKIQMEAAKMAGQLLDAEEVQQAWGDFLSRLKVNLDGLPDRAAPLIEDGMNLAEKVAAIRRELNSVRRDLVAETERSAQHPEAV